MDDFTYWAAERDPDKLASLLKQRIERFRDSCNDTGRRMLWSRAIRMFYGLDPEGGYRSSHYVNVEGAQGQFLGARLNLYRSFCKSMLTMIVGSRPPHNCVPSAYDADTNEVVEIGNAYLDKALDDGVEATAGESATRFMVMGEGWLLTTWDDGAGKIVAGEEFQGPDGQVYSRPIAEGEVRVLSLRPDQVIRDPDDTGDPGDHRWLCASVQRSRWDLAAQYPLYAEEILRAKDDERRWLYGVEYNRASTYNSEMIGTYELYHRKTLALPNGLFALMVGDTIVSLTDLQYDELPFDPMIAEREPGSPFGYCPSWDMMAIQTSVDSVWMQMATNRENFGTPNIFLPVGSNIEPYNGGGARVIQGTQPPVVVDMSNGGIESGERFMAMAQQGMQRISGLSDASIGDVSSSTSGVALAQQQSVTQQYSAGNALAYVRMMQGSLRKQLRIAQRFIRDERMIHIAGKNRAAMVRRFKGEDFRALEGVNIELGSASTRDSGSRHVIANELLQAGMLGDPKVIETYMEMIATGRNQPATNGPFVRETQAERLMQEVQEGRGYIVSPSMQHAMMIARLADTEADPSIDTQTLALVQQLQQQHGDIWMQMSSTPQGQGLLFATGQQPHPAAMMMMQQAQQPPAGGQPGEPVAEQAPAPADAPQPSPSGMQSGPAGQPSLPEGATPTA